MTHLVQTILLGLLIGGVYALLASGLTLIFGVMGIINVAHGVFLVLAGLLTYELWVHLGLDPILASVITTPVMFALGWLVYRGLVARIRTAPVSMSVLLTFALAITIEGLMGMTWKNVFRSVTPSYFNQSFHLGPLFLPKGQVYACAAAILVLAALYGLLTRTWMGRAIRSASQNAEGALLVGIDIRTVAALTFAIGIGTTGAGGSIMSVLYALFPASHYVWISRLLGIIVLGGMGSLPGAVIGALLLGVAEALTITYVSTRWAVAVFYIVILVVLLIRPQGIMGARVREDVVA
ncbi:MAG: branched-chain amino acid ABC transporter permease [Candidatus Velamenicoccus archaeovorus]